MVASSDLKEKLSTKSLCLLDELIQSLKEPGGGIGTDGCDDASSYACIEEERVRFDLAAEVLLLEVSRIRAKRNAFSPINKLPVELFSRIFLFGALSDIRDSAPLPSSSIAASHVCRRWRQISLSTPSLWTHFRLKTCCEWASRAEELLLPQDVLVLPDNFNPENSQDCGDCEPNLRNMRSLRISLRALRWNFDPLSLASYMSLPAPNLTFLQLTGEEYYDDSDAHCYSHVRLPPSPFQGQHNLRHVVISCCALSWDSSIFTGLRRLELHGVPDAFHMRVDELLSILGACPAMEELAIMDCQFAQRNVPLRTVPLPRLRSLLWDTNLGYVPSWSGWFKALHNILISRNAELTLRCATSSYDIHAILGETHDLAHLGPAAPRDVSPPVQIALSRCRHLGFGYPDRKDWVNEYEDPGFPERITIDFSGEILQLFSRPTELDYHEPTPMNFGASMLMACFASHLPPDCPIRTLSLFRGEPLDGAAFVGVMRALPHLAKITLSEISFECAEEIFKALADPQWSHRIEEVVFHRSAEFLSSLAAAIEPYFRRKGKACVRRVTLRDCAEVNETTMFVLKRFVEVVQD
ncbi:hypothetical protein BOTBODRAFT_33164 [Botryobasidium botryosum FD-172 SS1]|uniref:F-box domain-containing protein n=1 Tax=Botryobasidium botryosum (strain FD-172 SS1) TaxID=930990 RepID=A0A067MQ80_BOTB1|nr:hypothetical protein BOTBODRAFT_33164 [Botryobasidium botryosum FD-172 SS1]